jgi:sentrin-specific protease 8
MTAEAVACIGDVLLYETDVATLAPRAWLGDLVIAFFFELFAARLAGGEGADLASATAATSASNPAGVLLLEPTVSYMAAVLGTAEALREVLSVPRTAGAPPLTQRMAEAQLVLIPISDKADPDAAIGGSHWSLLAFRRAGTTPGAAGDCAFEHYDSAGGANTDPARAVARALAPLLVPAPLPPGCSVAGLGSPASAAGVVVHQMLGPKQINGHDCGVYTVAIAELLCALSVAGQLPPLGVVLPEVRALTPALIEERRRGMRETVQAARAVHAGKRRASGGSTT